MKINIKYFVLTATVFIVLLAKAQDNKYEEFIIKNKIYKPGSSWLKIGEGYGYHFRLQKFEYNTVISYSFRVKDIFLQGGYHVSSDKFFTQHTYQKLNDFYFAAGWRSETIKSNISVFAGPAYAYGGTFDHISYENGKYEKWYRGFNQLGLYACADYTFKIFYDLGFGVSLYGSINKYYNVTGLQIHLYFSGAFKGEIK